MIHATLTGQVDAIARTKLAAKQARAGIKSGVSKLVKIGAKTAKRSLVRKRTGLLAKAIGSKVKVNGDKVFGIVGIKSGFKTTLGQLVKQKRGAGVFQSIRGTDKNVKAGKGKAIKIKNRGNLKTGDVLSPARYGHFIELGHIKGKGKSAAPAYPFVKPAMEESKAIGPATITQEMNQVVGK